MTPESSFRFPSRDPERDGLTLDRYLAGECPPHERAVIDAWFAAHPRNQAQVAAMSGIAHDAIDPTARLRAPDIEKLRAGTWQRIRSVDGSSQHPGVQRRFLSRVGRTGSGARPMSRARWAAGIVGAGVVAAAVILALGLGIGRLSFFRESSAPTISNAQQYIAMPGRRVSIHLADGSKVILAPGSTLRTAPRFGRDTRDVSLEGEAYFDVVHDAGKPFRVRTAQGVVRDIGTRFTVRAYAEDTASRVVVTEGQVDVGANVVLAAGDLAFVSIQAAPVVRRGVPVRHFVSWIDGELEFVDAPLRDAAHTLGRWYGVDIRIDHPSLLRQTITLTFRDASVSMVLERIARVVGARVERQGTRYVLVPAASDAGASIR